MSTKIKIALDIIGILISLVGFVLLVSKEKYVISGLLFLFFVVLIVYGAKLALSKPYQVKKIICDYVFCDAEAKLAKITKTVILVPKEKNITKIEDLGFSGQISNISSNQGSVSTRDAGGNTSVTTIFDTALELEKEYTHILKCDAENCFPKKKENVMYTIIHKIDNAVIKINFHKNRRPSNFKAIHRVGSKVTEVTKDNVDVDNLSYTFSFNKPPRGSVFTLTWEW